MHKLVSTSDEFGVRRKGVFVPYCNETYAAEPGYSQAVRHPSFDRKLTATCNPHGFEYVPIARMASSNVPEHMIQIKAIRAERFKSKGGQVIIRWLGLQGGKYVSLPTEWVVLNFDKTILDEAQRRVEFASTHQAGDQDKRWLCLPIGDSRDDDQNIVVAWIEYFQEDTG